MNGKTFVEVCRRRGLKVNAGKSKVMILNGEEGFECEVHVDGIQLDYGLEFQYLGCVLDESGTDKVVIGRKVAGAFRFLVSTRGLQLDKGVLWFFSHGEIMIELLR